MPIRKDLFKMFDSIVLVLDVLTHAWFIRV